MKILIVDDSLVVRNAIARSTHHAAHGGAIDTVLRAEDGEQAVEIFGEHRPELVTMDLTMPRLDGLAAIRRIRELEPRTSILVISALNSHRMAVEAIRSGACGFLTKPFTEREVSEAIDQLVDHAQAHRR